MNDDQNWREPTEEEHEMFYRHLTEVYGRTDEEVSKALQTAYMVVLENFVSTPPGYTGRILIVMYGYPESLEGYLFNEDADEDTWDTELHRHASP